jgi:hypothetical protein
MQEKYMRTAVLLASLRGGHFEAQLDGDGRGRELSSEQLSKYRV